MASLRQIRDVGHAGVAGMWCRAGTYKDYGCRHSAARESLSTKLAEKTSPDGLPMASERGSAYITSICEFHDSMRSGEIDCKHTDVN